MMFKIGWWLMGFPIEVYSDGRLVRNWRWRRYKLGAWMCNQ